jgi:hypothetical protein
MQESLSNQVKQVEILPHFTVEQASHSVMRYMPEDLLEAYYSLGKSKQEIIDFHPKYMGEDSTLSGHAKIISSYGKKFNVPPIVQTAFDIHDDAEAFLLTDGRIHDFITGQKTFKDKLDETLRLVYLLEKASATPAEIDQIVQVISKKGQYGHLLKTAEQQNCVKQARDMEAKANYLDKTTNKSAITCLSIRNMRRFVSDIKGKSQL